MKTSTKKFENLTFLVSLVKNLKNYSCFYFLAKTAQKMCLTMFQKENIMKTSTYKSPKIFFFKGISPWFQSKIGNFSIFLFQARKERQGNFRKKNAFLDYKNKLKRSKNQDFSMVSVKNQQLFLPFILSKIGRECVFHEILKRKNAFLECKSKKFKENLAFFQRVHGCA